MADPTPFRFGPTFDSPCRRPPSRGPSTDGSRPYLGGVSGEAIVAADIFRDLLASVRGIVGGRLLAVSSRSDPSTTRRRASARRRALRASPSAAARTRHLDDETLGQGGSTLMVCASGTAVFVEVRSA
jgi:uncharacterized protein YbjQ (UPF0145 family)